MFNLPEPVQRQGQLFQNALLVDGLQRGAIFLGGNVWECIDTPASHVTPQYYYIGRDFRENQSIGRKQGRILNKAQAGCEGSQIIPHAIDSTKNYLYTPQGILNIHDAPCSSNFHIMMDLQGNPIYNPNIPTHENDFNAFMTQGIIISYSLPHLIGVAQFSPEGLDKDNAIDDLARMLLSYESPLNKGKYFSPPTAQQLLFLFEQSPDLFNRIKVLVPDQLLAFIGMHAHDALGMGFERRALRNQNATLTNDNNHLNQVNKLQSERIRRYEHALNQNNRRNHPSHESMNQLTQQHAREIAEKEAAILALQNNVHHLTLQLAAHNASNNISIHKLTQENIKIKNLASTAPKLTDKQQDKIANQKNELTQLQIALEKATHANESKDAKIRALKKQVANSSHGEFKQENPKEFKLIVESPLASVPQATIAEPMPVETKNRRSSHSRKSNHSNKSSHLTWSTHTESSMDYQWLHNKIIEVRENNNNVKHKNELDIITAYFAKRKNEKKNRIFSEEIKQFFVLLQELSEDRLITAGDPLFYCLAPFYSPEAIANMKNPITSEECVDAINEMEQIFRENDIFRTQGKESNQERFEKIQALIEAMPIPDPILNIKISIILQNIKATVEQFKKVSQHQKNTHCSEVMTLFIREMATVEAGPIIFDTEEYQRTEAHFLALGKKEQEEISEVGSSFIHWPTPQEVLTITHQLQRLITYIRNIPQPNTPQDWNILAQKLLSENIQEGLPYEQANNLLQKNIAILLHATEQNDFDIKPILETLASQLRTDAPKAQEKQASYHRIQALFNFLSANIKTIGLCSTVLTNKMDPAKLPANILSPLQILIHEEFESEIAQALFLKKIAGQSLSITARNLVTLFNQALLYRASSATSSLIVRSANKPKDLFTLWSEKLTPGIKLTPELLKELVSVVGNSGISDYADIFKTLFRLSIQYQHTTQYNLLVDGQLLNSICPTLCSVDFFENVSKAKNKKNFILEHINKARTEFYANNILSLDFDELGSQRIADDFIFNAVKATLLTNPSLQNNSDYSKTLQVIREALTPVGINSNHRLIKGIHQ